MKFSEIFKNVIYWWPESIDISDVKYLSDSRLSFKNLSKIWFGIDEKSNKMLAKKEVSEWESLMVWSVFCVLLDTAKILHKKESTLFPEKIDIKAFESMYYEHLQEEGYEDMLSEYERDF